MTDPNLLYSPEHSISLLSKSSPSQLQAFQFKRSRTEPIPTENLSLQKGNKISNLSHVPCKFFKQGTCTAGANCTFSHSSDFSSESSVCRYFIKGNCKFGTKCALLHTMSPYSNSNSNSSNSGMNSGSGSNSSSDSVDRKHNIMMLRKELNERSGSATIGNDDLIWNPRDFMATTTTLNSSSSPHTSTSFGTSPFSNSNSKWSILPPLSSSFDNNNNSYISNNISIDNHRLYQQHQRHHNHHQQQHDNGYDDDLNDAMLPSSLNDLFTPTELQLRRRRQQEAYSSSYNPTREVLSEPLSNGSSKWRVPFVTKHDWLDYDDNHRMVHQEEEEEEEEDDVQFFMEEDVDEVVGAVFDKIQQHHHHPAALSTLFQNNMKITQNNHSLL